ncbi:mobile element protein [Bosea sp. BIWAKO-01]|nr:mobile element protein [Bosea sp. BIWAKO-01]
MTNRDCRPIAFQLTSGQGADCASGAALVKQMPAARTLHGDRGYDSNAILRQVEENGTMPNFPPKADWRWKNCFSPLLYYDRNAIERMFGRPKDFHLSPHDMTFSPPSASPRPSALFRALRGYLRTFAKTPRILKMHR